jgi:hypothetical protein
MLIGILWRGGGIGLVFPICYSLVSRMDDSHQGPVAYTAEAEIIGTVI